MKKKSLIIFFVIMIALLPVFLLFPSKESSKKVSPYASTKIACLGDSITLGARVPNPFPKMLQKELEANRVFNYGVSGSTVTYGGIEPMCVRCDEMPNDLDIIFVLGGTNDFWANMELGTINDTGSTTFYGAYKMMLNKLQKKYPDALILVATPYQMQNGSTANSCGYVLKDYANAILHISKEYHIPCIDFYNDGGIEKDYTKYTFDGVHPTQVFYNEFTVPQLKDFIKEHY